MPDQQAYIGRFAPSPTGPLHLGSLFTALAGFLHARSHHGKWLLRIDDLDTPRNIPGSDRAILSTLETFGLHWDGPVDYQSQFIPDYESCLTLLDRAKMIYPCTCSRKNLTIQSSGSLPMVYPGICRRRRAIPNRPYAMRIKTDNRVIEFIDDLQGTVQHHLARKDGDFIVKRKDFIIAYQLAVVIDDARQKVNHIVRGCDLLQETPKQIYLQQMLNLPSPGYMHVPLIVDRDGYKLSKQTLATAVDINRPQLILYRLLKLLKQHPPKELEIAPVQELIDWAIAHWNPKPLKNFHAIHSEAC